jgi:adenylate kinase family enzyme
MARAPISKFAPVLRLDGSLKLAASSFGREILSIKVSTNIHIRTTMTTHSRPVLFICGPAASGKGTLLEGICKDYDFMAISTGDVLRAEVARGTELGKRIGEILAKGQLVPPEVAVTLLKQEMESCKQRGILLDGFPRSKEQRDAWYAQLGAPTACINLDCAESILVERCLGRAREAQAKGLPVRSDDNIDTLKKRFATHQQQCVPVMEQLKTELGSRLFCEIDASKDKESIRTTARQFLATLQIHPVVAGK